MSLPPTNRLRGLKALQRPSSLPSASARVVVPADAALPATAAEAVECRDWVAEALGGEVRRNGFGEYVSIRQWFPEPGNIGFDDAALRLLAPQQPEAVSDPAQWLFLDTETTGLAGGTGTYAFLVGVAWLDGGGLQVEQFFMRDLNEEWAVLQALTERLQERPVLVTFNGKSFDWPLLETRYRMTRSLETPELRSHLDLLHPARSLWRLRLGSVRLAELEREILGCERGEDLASELIPHIYLEFLRGGSPEPILPILRHNRMDLQGLAAITGRVLSLLSDGGDGHDGFELYGLSRLCERRGELQRARAFCERSVASALPAETDRIARRSLARMAKRAGDYELAVELWQKGLGSSKEGLRAYEQLAIHYEHRARELQRAADVTRQALAELRAAHRLGTLAPITYIDCKNRFEYRLARLRRKIDARTGAGDVLRLIP